MKGPDLELEERLRRLAPAFKDGNEPPATLHVSVMTAATAPRLPARRSIVRELSLAAALVAFVALLAFGFSRLHSVNPGPVKRSPSPSPVSRVIPWTSATPLPLKLQAPKTLTVDQAAQDVRQTVTQPQPVLLPRAIPSGFQAQLYDDAGSFSFMYVAGDGRFIQFSIIVPNPPPGSPNVRQSQPTFRSVRADYQVDDATLPAGQRWLMWTEPGTPYDGQPGVPYFLRTDGFTESEFWTIANSIGPIPVPVVPAACTLADVDVTPNGSSGATGHIVYSITFTNHGTAACSLSGSPDIVLVTKQGTRLALPEQKAVQGFAGSPGVDQAVLPPNQVVPSPHAGTANSAYVLFEWYYCGATPPPIGAFDVALPGSTASRRVPLLDEGLAQGPSRCDDPAQGRVLRVTPIQGPNAGGIAVTAPALRVSLTGVPGTLVAGQTLRYEVTVTNESNTPIAFDTCPAYDEGFTPNAMVSYLLNCGSIGRLEAGASATFAMEFTIQPWPKAPTGEQKFLWRLHGAYAGASAGRLVTVTGS